jgi:hypothetical protein
LDGEEGRGEQREVGSGGGFVHAADGLGGVPRFERVSYLGAVDEPVDDASSELGFDFDGSAELLAGRAGREPLLAEAGERAKDRGEVRGVEGAQDGGGVVEERNEQRLWERGEFSGLLDRRFVSDAHAYTR